MWEVSISSGQETWREIKNPPVKPICLNTESRHPLKPNKLQSVVFICPGSIPFAFSSPACFPDPIPRVLGHPLAPQLIFGWYDFGDPLEFPPWVSVGSCLILSSTFLSGSVSSFVREQKRPTWASPHVLYGRRAGGLGRVIHVKLCLGLYAPHNALRVCHLLEMGG